VKPVSDERIQLVEYASVPTEDCSARVFVGKGDRYVGKRLYVGNLSYSVTSPDLQQLFSQFGQVTNATVMQDRETGRSKGFGFVEMSTDQEAQAAIDGLHNTQQGGPSIDGQRSSPQGRSSSWRRRLRRRRWWLRRWWWWLRRWPRSSRLRSLQQFYSRQIDQQFDPRFASKRGFFVS
jgi:RNA recognition motif-containing protein